MSSKRIFDLPQMRGSFNIRGRVTGTEKNNFYSERATKNGSVFRNVNFGVTYDNAKTVYLTEQGMPRDKVYFSKRDPQTKKNETKAVNWSARNTFDEEGFKLIGTSIGIEKVPDENGTPKNLVKTMTEFDACEYLSEHLNDDMFVNVTGSLDFSSYVNKNGEVRRKTQYMINRMYATKAPIDFDAEDFQPTNVFVQTIMFNGIEREIEDDAPTGRFVLSAYIVNYKTIEPVDFIVENKTLANTFKKNLKPYNAIQVNGRISVKNMIEEVEVDDAWGTSNPMKRVNAPSVRELIITGADVDSLDVETYNEKNVNAAFKAIQNSQQAESDFGGSSDWGSEAFDDSASDIW